MLGLTGGLPPGGLCTKSLPVGKPTIVLCMAMGPVWGLPQEIGQQRRSISCFFRNSVLFHSEIQDGCAVPSRSDRMEKTRALPHAGVGHEKPDRAGKKMHGAPQKMRHGPKSRRLPQSFFAGPPQAPAGRTVPAIKAWPMATMRHPALPACPTDKTY